MDRKFYTIHSKSFEKYKAKNDKELWKAVKAKGFNGLSVEAKTTFKKSEEGDKFHAVFSTAKEDRHGEVVEQGWDLKHFKKNPVYLDSHNYSSIDYIIGKVHKIKVKDNKLEGDIEFALDNPRGEMASKMASKGFLNTSSVGFIPKEFDDKGRMIKNELLEISGVGVPANPEALYEKYYEDDYRPLTSDDTKGEQDTSESEGEREEDRKEEAEEKKVKIKTPAERIYKTLKQEDDIKKRALRKISTAIKLVCEETKGRNSLKKDRADINNEINKAVRNLLKLKVKQ